MGAALRSQRLEEFIGKFGERIEASHAGRTVGETQVAGLGNLEFEPVDTGLGHADADISGGGDWQLENPAGALVGEREGDGLSCLAFARSSAIRVGIGGGHSASDPRQSTC